MTAEKCCQQAPLLTILTETGIQQEKRKEKCNLHAETGIQQGT